MQPASGAPGPVDVGRLPVEVRDPPSDSEYSSEREWVPFEKDAHHLGGYDSEPPPVGEHLEGRPRSKEGQAAVKAYVDWMRRCKQRRKGWQLQGVLWHPRNLNFQCRAKGGKLQVVKPESFDLQGYRKALEKAWRARSAMVRGRDKQGRPAYGRKASGSPTGSGSGGQWCEEEMLDEEAERLMDQEDAADCHDDARRSSLGAGSDDAPLAAALVRRNVASRPTRSVTEPHHHHQQQRGAAMDIDSPFRDTPPMARRTGRQPKPKLLSGGVPVSVSVALAAAEDLEAPRSKRPPRGAHQQPYFAAANAHGHGHGLRVRRADSMQLQQQHSLTDLESPCFPPSHHLYQEGPDSAMLPPPAMGGSFLDSASPLHHQRRRAANSEGEGSDVPLDELKPRRQGQGALHSDPDASPDFGPASSGALRPQRSISGSPGLGASADSPMSASGRGEACTAANQYMLGVAGPGAMECDPRVPEGRRAPLDAEDRALLLQCPEGGSLARITHCKGERLWVGHFYCPQVDAEHKFFIARSAKRGHVVTKTSVEKWLKRVCARHHLNLKNILLENHEVPFTAVVTARPISVNHSNGLSPVAERPPPAQCFATATAALATTARAVKSNRLFADFELGDEWDADASGLQGGQPQLSYGAADEAALLDDLAALSRSPDCLGPSPSPHTHATRRNRDAFSVPLPAASEPRERPPKERHHHHRHHHREDHPHFDCSWPADELDAMDLEGCAPDASTLEEVLGGDDTSDWEEPLSALPIDPATGLPVRKRSRVFSAGPGAKPSRSPLLPPSNSPPTRMVTRRQGPVDEETDHGLEDASSPTARDASRWYSSRGLLGSFSGLDESQVVASFLGLQADASDPVRKKSRRPAPLSLLDIIAPLPRSARAVVDASPLSSTGAVYSCDVHAAPSPDVKPLAIPLLPESLVPLDPPRSSSGMPHFAVFGAAGVPAFGPSATGSGGSLLQHALSSLKSQNSVPRPAQDAGASDSAAPVGDSAMPPAVECEPVPHAAAKSKAATEVAPDEFVAVKQPAADVSAPRAALHELAEQAGHDTATAMEVDIQTADCEGGDREVRQHAATGVVASHTTAETLVDAPPTTAAALTKHGDEACMSAITPPSPGVVAPSGDAVVYHVAPLGDPMIFSLLEAAAEAELELKSGSTNGKRRANTRGSQGVQRAAYPGGGLYRQTSALSAEEESMPRQAVPKRRTRQAASRKRHMDDDLAYHPHTSFAPSPLSAPLEEGDSLATLAALGAEAMPASSALSEERRTDMMAAALDSLRTGHSAHTAQPTHAHATRNKQRKSGPSASAALAAMHGTVGASAPYVSPPSALSGGRPAVGARKPSSNSVGKRVRGAGAIESLGAILSAAGVARAAENRSQHVSPNRQAVLAAAAGGAKQDDSTQAVAEGSDGSQEQAGTSGSQDTPAKDASPSPSNKDRKEPPAPARADVWVPAAGASTGPSLGQPQQQPMVVRGGPMVRARNTHRAAPYAQQRPGGPVATGSGAPGATMAINAAQVVNARGTPYFAPMAGPLPQPGATSHVARPMTLGGRGSSTVYRQTSAGSSVGTPGQLPSFAQPPPLQPQPHYHHQMHHQQYHHTPLAAPHHSPQLLPFAQGLVHAPPMHAMPQPLSTPPSGPTHLPSPLAQPHSAPPMLHLHQQQGAPQQPQGPPPGVGVTVVSRPLQLPAGMPPHEP